MLENIPMELRQRTAWVVAASDKVPLNPRTGQPASVVDSSTWGTFDEACRAGYKHVGFVFSKSDEFSGVDLDSPDTPEQEERHRKICAAFDCYQELSQSGRGIHLICRGSVPSGIRRDRVEVYSDSRYFVFTGNVVKNAPISDCQKLLDKLYEEMSPATRCELEELPATISDEELLSKANAAKNQEKFKSLWSGQINGHPSQSEADFALISMLAFYSKSNEQVRRIFRQSQLGKREKTTRNDYHINKALEGIRGRQEAETLPEIDFTELLRPRVTIPTPPPIPAPKQNNFPPGLIGEIADYIYASAPRPVAEVGLVSALAFGAGILGRQFNISASGLNQYIILLGATGVGKEAAESGITRLLNSVENFIPQAQEFMGPAVFASGQALTRVLEKSTCFVSVLDEIGITLQQICDKRAASHQVQMRKALLFLYGKSGWNQYLRASVYSDTAKNTIAIKAPNVSILGLSTPEKFYDALDREHIAEGTVPRFLVVDYTGKRPHQNKNHSYAPPDDLRDKLVKTFQTVLAMKYNDQCCAIPCDASSDKMMDDWNDYADDQANNSDDDMVKQIWSRSHLKALKLAGLIAAGCNVDRPVVTKDLAGWSIEMIKTDVENMLAKFSSGEVGHGDHKCESDVKKALEKYPLLSPKQRMAYNVPEKIADRPQAIPFIFIKRYCNQRVAFKNDRRGAVQALEVTLRDMLKAGIISQVPADKALETLGVSSPIYYRGESYL